MNNKLTDKRWAMFSIDSKFKPQRVIEQQINNLRHWANMAELTAEQLSCLTPKQLREIADTLAELKAETDKAQVYEKIYGPLRQCPGADSIIFRDMASMHGISAHLGCIPFYCEFGHVHLRDIEPVQGCHTHSLSGGDYDTNR